MNTPSTTNKTADTVNTVIDGAISSLETVAENLIIADVPFLGTPVIKEIWQDIFHWIMGYASRAAQTGATFAIIDIQVDKEKSNISNALAALIAAEKLGNSDGIKKAIQDYQKAQSSLVNADGSSTPK